MGKMKNQCLICNNFKSMKKILYVLFMIMFITSCTSTGINNKNIDIATIKVQGNLHGNINIQVLRFEYEGHNYICFRPNSKYNKNIIHDPNCPCHKK